MTTQPPSPAPSTAAPAARLRRARQVGRGLLARFRSAQKPQDDPRSTLLVLASDLRWDAVVLGPDGQMAHRLGEDCPLLQAAPDGLTERVLQRAVQALPDEQRAAVKDVRLVLADPQVEMLDSRMARLPEGDLSVIRKAGARFTRGEAAAFGSLGYGRGGQRRIHAFLASSRLRSYLFALGRLAPSTTCVTPLQALLLQAARRDGDEPYAALYLAGDFCLLVIANPETGALAARCIPIGARTFAMALVQETGISLSDALAGLAARDCLGRLATLAADDPRASSTLLRLLAPILARLREEIAATLDYFTYHRMGGVPAYLGLYQEGATLRGFSHWLESAVDLPLVAARPLIEAMRPAGGTPVLNLLEGAPPGLLTVGRTSYRYLDGRFVSATETARQPPRAAGKARKSDRGSAHEAAEADAGPADGQASPPLAFAGLAAALAVLAFLSWDSFVAPAALRQQVAADTYAARLAERRTAAGPAPGQLSGDERRLAADRNRLLWSEKLLAVATHIGPDLWLTDLQVAPAGRLPGATRSKTLVLEGRLARSPRLDLGPIAAFLAALEADAEFSSDCEPPSFAGARIDEAPGAQTIRFRLDTVCDGERRPASSARALPGPSAEAGDG